MLCVYSYFCSRYLEPALGELSNPILHLRNSIINCRLCAGVHCSVLRNQIAGVEPAWDDDDGRL